MRNRGYTLIEVLIVVSIIGIASAVVVPQMLAGSSLGIQAAARTLIADLLYAQNEAVVQQRGTRVVIDTSADRYWLQWDDGTPLELNWRVGGPNSIDFRTDSRFRDVRLARVTLDGSTPTFINEGGQIVIEFDELGAPVQGGGSSIGLISARQRFYVRVAPFTGRVTVHNVVPQ
jgi:prepilin-type N-terminal cleavage/methylation domain-containing protein